MSGLAGGPARQDPSRLLRELLAVDPRLSKHRLAQLGNDQLSAVSSKILSALRQQRRERQLAFYEPVSDKAMQVHTTDARRIGIGGGNGSSKTETALVELAMMTTGVFPPSVREAVDVTEKFRGPINVRVVCESLTTVLHPIILPKLQWWKWTGVSAPGGDQGHWGWIPRDHLIGASWERSWSEKLRILRVLCRDPENPGKVLGESTWQFMSRDQDPSDFASGDYHYVLLDEPPTKAIYRENEARTMRVSGKIILAMTWPDDPAIAVDWIFDELYEPAQQGVEDKLWIELYTTENRHLDQEAVSAQQRDWDEKTAQVRIYGKPIRFSNRIHPLFTDQEDWWCFDCGETVLPATFEPLACGRCQGRQVSRFSHVEDFDVHSGWPCIFLLDPHPRKPHMYQWWQVDPSDDLWMVAEGECAKSPMEVRDDVEAMERTYGLTPTQRLIDPNMGRSPSSSVRREATWQDDFDAVGIRTDLASDSDMGRSRVNEYLRPDPMTWQPRLHVHPRCQKTIFQMKRYVWDDWKQSTERSLKQRPKDKDDDHPTMMKYLLNAEPTFRGMAHVAGVVRRRAPPPRGHREGRWVVG